MDFIYHIRFLESNQLGYFSCCSAHISYYNASQSKLTYREAIFSFYGAINYAHSTLDINHCITNFAHHDTFRPNSYMPQ